MNLLKKTCKFKIKQNKNFIKINQTSLNVDSEAMKLYIVFYTLTSNIKSFYK